MTIRAATISDLAQLAPLFDGYRQFYQQPTDVEGATEFLRARLKNQESVIFVSFDEQEKLTGFVQLYPSFSSVGMRTTWVLNDLFVSPAYRKMKYGEALLLRAMEFSRESGARNLSLQTALTNANAQALYEKLGWKRDVKYYTYYFFH